MEGKEAAVQPAAFPGQQAGFDLYAGGAQLLNAAAGYQGKRVVVADNDFGYAFFDEQVGAGRSFAVVGAGLQRHVHAGFTQ